MSNFIETNIYNNPNVTGSFVTPGITNSNLVTYAFQMNFGAIFGTLGIDESNDGVNYLPVTDTNNVIIAQPVSGPGSGMITIVNSGAKYARLNFTYTSGSGAVSVIVESKG